MSQNILVLRRDTADVIKRRHPIESIVLENMVKRGEARIIEEEHACSKASA
jgi:hypothetical protein